MYKGWNKRVLLVRQKDNKFKNKFISVQMYTLIRSISAGVSEIKGFECSNSLWILKLIPRNEYAVTVLLFVFVFFTWFFPLCFTKISPFHISTNGRSISLLSGSLSTTSVSSGCSLSLSSEPLLSTSVSPVLPLSFNRGRWR